MLYSSNTIFFFQNLKSDCSDAYVESQTVHDIKIKSKARTSDVKYEEWLNAQKSQHGSIPVRANLSEEFSSKLCERIYTDLVLPAAEPEALMPVI